MNSLCRLTTVFGLVCILAGNALSQDNEFATRYETSGYRASPRYRETMQFLRTLQSASPWIRLTTFGVTPQGRDLPLVILSRQRLFTAEKARKSGLPVVLIQSGIHAGEIDGKDASLLLLRDIVVRRLHQQLPESAILLFMPIFNLDGHERQSRYNRINQDGPEEMGWRVTARNLNLNRDYLKADAQEMRAWLRCFNEWQPDMVIDCHVTDGIDFQYNATYSMEMFGNAPASVVSWQREFERSMIRGMEAQGDPVCPYVFPREDRDISKGMETGVAPPRFSTGYAAIRNRAALLIETHMLKPYKARVTATYRILLETLSFIARNPGSLRRAVRQADEETARMFASSADSASFPVQFQATAHSRTIEFLGYQSEMRHSEVSGGDYIVWDHRRPVTVKIPYFDDIRPSALVRPPLAYVIPQEWTEVIDVLHAHGLQMERLSRETDITVESIVFSDAKWRTRPYEGRMGMEQRKQSTLRETIAYPAGTFILRLDQPSAKAAIHLLEPDAPDSFVGWGFFNAMFEQKEYFEDYVMEKLASEMLSSDEALRSDFETRLAADTAFAQSPRARLQFFYERSPYVDSRLNVYPVGRYFGTAPLPAVREVAFRRKPELK